MLVIGCCAINRLSVSCQVFSVVECLIIKTVEKKHSKLPEYFLCCLFLIACGYCSDIVPVKGWGGRVLLQAGLGMGMVSVGGSWRRVLPVGGRPAMLFCLAQPVV